jgi:energy-coupling factor transporter ATP-binding protein EcfA2
LLIHFSLFSGDGTSADDSDVVISFSVDDGEKVVLLGATDCEKSKFSDRMKWVIKCQNARVIENADCFDEGDSVLDEVAFSFFPILFDHD